MAHGNLREFDSSNESIKDFCERFKFYCVANNIRDDAARRKKALFLTLLGQATYAKFKDLASPTLISELTLDEIMRHLEGHYRPQPIEIAECLSFSREVKRSLNRPRSLWQH